ncbi:hypothetical protein GCM10007094_18970 [Pseudovibrio japonicus]|uniref:Uncharacterized protein n=1 Tax=Pseudovibrio japonicus TaxID=366534 RepID=A0ABQ3EB32_9HYPH|nr:hypothetical protein [Pseudovibrio japonicus]GHB30745.1 hypothetical protein GCM10007094_18970 [Pseudovibrio japonicus]
MNKRHFGAGALTAISTSLLLAATSYAAPPNNVSGQVLVPINHIAGLKEDGSADLSVTTACQEKYASILGEEVLVEYQISATQNRAVAMLENTQVNLTPLGIPDTYSFTSDRIPPPLSNQGFQRIIFSMEDDFEDEVIHIIAAGDQSTDKCFLSTEPFRLRQ